MKNTYLALIISLILMPLSAFTPGQNPPEFKVVKTQHLRELLFNESDTTFVVNFWATWCKPCIEELPVFQQTETDYQNQKVAFIYVSLDAVENMKSVKKFLQNKGFNGNIWLLDETDFNSIINMVDVDWSGTLPYTLIFKGSKKTGIYKALQSKEYLVEKINVILND